MKNTSKTKRFGTGNRQLKSRRSRLRLRAILSMLAVLPAAGFASHLIAQHPTGLPPIDGLKAENATGETPVTKFSIQKFEQSIR